MAALLQGELEEPTEPKNPIDLWRIAIMEFVEEHWSVLEPQITCPAKSRDPRACFGCIDAQVITCVVSNDHNEYMIRRHFEGDK
jgi:hypothetical protein